jgi:hypothetical protein
MGGAVPRLSTFFTPTQKGPKYERFNSHCCSKYACQFKHCCAIADPLPAEENLFVTVTLASLVVPIRCEGYQIIDGGLLRLGDATGVDAHRLVRAVVASFSAAKWW